DLDSGRKLAVRALHLSERTFTLVAIDVDDGEARLAAGCKADVLLRPALPPTVDHGQVRRCVQTAPLSWRGLVPRLAPENLKGPALPALGPSGAGAGGGSCRLSVKASSDLRERVAQPTMRHMQVPEFIDKCLRQRGTRSTGLETHARVHLLYNLIQPDAKC